MPPSRLRLLKATSAPAACVIRRGPTSWFHLARWWYERGEVEHGAWTKIKLYPERCAISADADRLAVFALGGEWGAYFAVSRAPWLHALVAWKTVGTWTTGAHFEEDGSLVLGGCADPEPFSGVYPLPVACVPVDTHWVRARVFRELRTGWNLHASKQGGTDGLEQPDWVERLPVPISASPDAIVIGKPDPADASRELVLVSLGEKHREYYLREAGDFIPVETSASAEWGADGELLLATRAGRLTVLDRSLTTRWEYDMNRFTPEPRAAPEWAMTW